MKRVDYKSGESINGITFIRNANPMIQPTGRSRRVAVFMCNYCGNEFNQRICDIVSGKTVSCGCKKHLGLNKKHGLKHTKYYNLWRNMKDRCLNPNHKQFKDYGGRGISIYKEWVNDFIIFFDYITKLEGYHLLGSGANHLSIDRIDVNGNYEPDNLRFASKSQQAKTSVNE